MRIGDGPTGLGGDRERIEALERTVRLLAETTRDALEALYDRDYGGLATDRQTESALNKALGRLDAVLSTLGVGAPRRGGEGEA